MRKLKYLALLAVAALALGGSALRADDDKPAVAPADPGTVEDGNRGSGSDNSGPSSGAGQVTGGVPQGLGRLINQEDPPDKLKKVELPDSVKELLKQFETAREDFLKARQDLVKLLPEADKDKRAEIRTQLAQAREAFVQKQRELRDQIRDQLREMREKLHDARDEQLDSARGQKGKRGGKRRG
ncbi:MAG: hypothetical protein HYY24_27130 [Verrucomicrobia bacterium]|nr:hypothetical protein [Verrucomicrobiota bacterium]